MTMLARQLHRLPIICLAKRHAARCRAQHERQILPRLPFSLTPGLARRPQQERRGTIQFGTLTRSQSRRGKGLRQIHLGGGFYPLTADIEK